MKSNLQWGMIYMVVNLLQLHKKDALVHKDRL